MGYQAQDFAHTPGQTPPGLRKNITLRFTEGLLSGLPLGGQHYVRGLA